MLRSRVVIVQQLPSRDPRTMSSSLVRITINNYHFLIIFCLVGWFFVFLVVFCGVFLQKFSKFYTRSLLIEFFKITNGDNSCSIFENLYSKTDTLNPQKTLTGSEKCTTAPYFKIVHFTTYSNPQSGGRSPAKLKCYRRKCVFYSDPYKSLTL